jgi:acyl-CoA synthetase (AMP-forming)/AMP-acid ligase II
MVSNASASTALLDDLPTTDPRLWVQTLQQLVASGMREGRLGLIRDASLSPLAPEAVLAVRDGLDALGARMGDVVLVKAGNDLHGAAAILGVWLHGCAACPVDPSAAPALHALIAEQSHAVAVIEADGRMARAGDARPTLLRARRATGVDLAMKIFTSGSSGSPKGVVLTHSNVVSSLRAIATYLRLGPADRVLCVPPMFLDYGIYQLLFTLFTGCELVLATGLKSPLKILDLIARSHPTVLPVVPALASGLTTVLNTFNQTVSSLRLVTNTGGHLAPATITALRRAFPAAQVVPMYGLTETKRALFLPPQLVDAKPGSVGGPMPGLDARVVVTRDNGELEEAEPGEVGELYLRGASVMQGYHREDGAAGARIIHGRWRDDLWLATGDLFERDADGCLFFRGRSKSLIKQKGFCIYPRDLEAVAEALPEVASAVVVGRNEPDGDESAVLFAVLDGLDGPESAPDPDAVRDRILAQLHKSVQPRYIEFLDAWPALAVGKIDLGALRRMAAEISR